MPSTNSTKRRHTKQPSSSKKAPPSEISTVSGSSTSSAATVTSRSFFTSSLRPSKRPGGNQPTEKINVDHGRSKSVAEPIQRSIHVFDYMEDDSDGQGDGDEDDGDKDIKEDEEDAEYRAGAKDEKIKEAVVEQEMSSSSSSMRSPGLPQTSPGYSDLEVRAMQDGLQHAWGRASLHSDSGISVRSGSPDQESPMLQHKLPTVLDVSDHEGDRKHTQYAENFDLETFNHSPPNPNTVFTRKHWPSLETDNRLGPEAYHVPTPPRLLQSPHNARAPPLELSPEPSRQMVKRQSNRQDQDVASARSGYDLLSSNIHSQGDGTDTILKPIYRKFEMLNNRMLLYLQDEIQEMEEQLRDLDAKILHEERSCGRRAASRRAEATFPSPLQWHRLDLLNRSFAKVEQYNRALTSYSNLAKSLEPASHADICAYRKWITEHAPVVEQETAFLQEESDLLSVSPQSVVKTSNLRAGSALETPVVVVAFGLLSTIIVFKVVPQIFARLVISAMVGIASLCTLSPQVMTDVKSVRDWGRAITTYSCIMIMLALVVS